MGEVAGVGWNSLLTAASAVRHANMYIHYTNLWAMKTDFRMSLIKSNHSGESDTATRNGAVSAGNPNLNRKKSGRNRDEKRH